MQSNWNHPINFFFQIIDPLQVYDNINLGRRIDPLWPDELWRSRGGRNSWKDWLPEEDMEGTVSLILGQKSKNCCFPQLF